LHKLFNSMTTGQKITDYLLKSEMDLTKIASKTAIPYMSLFQMQKRNDYKTSVLDKIADGLGITVSELIGSESDAPIILSKKANELKNRFPDFIDKIIKKGTNI
jgi:predicted transcriptional regulator